MTINILTLVDASLVDNEIMNKSFVEGRQFVSFDPTVRVIKLDKHRYYQYVSGRGFKGVDFMLIDLETLYLIELKDYNGRSQVSEEVMAKVFYEKCEDSLRLIEIINAYLHRKWWVRWCIRLRRYHWIKKEDRFWLDAHRCYLQGAVILLGNFEL